MTFEDDLIEVETPERVELSFPLAGLGSRFGALFVDILIMFLAYLVLYIIWGMITIPFAGAYSSSVTTGLLILAIFIVGNGYFIYFEYMWNGQTPGKRLAKIRVLKMGGLPVDLSSAMARNLMRLIDILLFSFTIGFFILFTSKLSQRPGDYVAGTFVVKDRDITIKDLEKYLASDDYTEIVTSANYDTRFNRLSNLDQRLINTFMERRSQMDPAQRRKTAANIVQGINRKINIKTDEFETDEMLIRSAYEALKSRKGTW